jgi:hypothetical protein
MPEQLLNRASLPRRFLQSGSSGAQRHSSAADMDKVRACVCTPATQPIFVLVCLPAGF